jgi:asparagine synthase (glutamine-hydrolysing)
MSGIFGIVDVENPERIPPLLENMASAMSHKEWFVVESQACQIAGLGRIGIGIFNTLPQPVWNEAHTIALVIAGEFYNTPALQLAPVPASDEATALALYEKHGPSFASHLKGAFIIAIWDTINQQLVITNDRFGLYPLFFAHVGSAFIFAPELKGILADHTIPRSLDMVALAQYMRFQHLLGDRTFFDNITLLPPAASLVFKADTARYTIEHYWSYNQIAYLPDISFQDAVEETGRLLRRAVQRLSGDSYRPGVYLSGGLDSRTILGLIERRPIATITYGHHNCRDVYYAQQIARRAGSDHHWIDMPDGNWVKEYADFHLELTEGLHSWIHMHGINTLEQARQLMDVNLTGWGGEVLGAYFSGVLGNYFYDRPPESPADHISLLARLFYFFNQKSTWPSIDEAEEYLVYSIPLDKKLRSLAFDSFTDEFSAYLSYPPDLQGRYFYINNHFLRLTHNLITFTRSHIEVRFPFFDYDLLDWVYALPAKMRHQRALYRAVIQQEIPTLATIPYDHDEFLPTTNEAHRRLHGLFIKSKRRINKHIRPFFPERHTLYADYENYLRTDLKAWAENILFDKRTLERGIFNPEFIQSIWARHQSGQELHTIGKIAPIITLEMMFRRFFD